jgi:hypothetical protein
MNTVQTFIVVLAIVALSEAQRLKAKDLCARCSRTDQETFKEIDGTLPLLNIAAKEPFVVKGVDYFQAALKYLKNKKDAEAEALLKSNVISRRVLTDITDQLEEFESEIQAFTASFVTIGEGCGICLPISEMVADLNKTTQDLQALNLVVELAKKVR